MPDPLSHAIIGGVVALLMMKYVKGFGVGRAALLVVGSVAIPDVDWLLVEYGFLDSYHALHHIGGIFLLAVVFTILWTILEPHLTTIENSPFKKIHPEKAIYIFFMAGCIHLVADLLVYAQVTSVPGEFMTFTPLYPLLDWEINYIELITQPGAIVGGWMIPASVFVLVAFVIGVLGMMKYTEERIV